MFRSGAKRLRVGMARRKGKVIATVVPNVQSTTVLPKVREKVLPSSVIYTNEFPTYDPITKMGYQHRRVHHASKVYVQGDAHTNTIEGFWSLVKRGIDGTHHAVSAKYLQDYINAYSFRWDHRNDEEPMFLQILSRLIPSLQA